MRLFRTENQGRWIEGHQEENHLSIITSKDPNACWSRQYDEEALAIEFRFVTGPLIEVAFWSGSTLDPDPECIFGFTSLWERLLTMYGFSYN